MTSGKTCKNDDCNRPLKSRGMCNTCYERWRRNGANGATLRAHRKPGMSNAQVVNHILEKTVINESSGCMIWQGATNGTGYGSLLYDGRIWVTHVLVQTILVGPRPDGMDCCHSRDCVSRRCVNPDHLRWDSRQANMIDAREVGTIANQRLSREDVTEIRAMIDSGEEPESVAERFDMTTHYLRRILRNDIWEDEVELS